MKYCKKCGTLLEDTIEVCIGCGTDVTDPDNVSKYPPNMAKKIAAEKKQNKTNTTTIIAIIVVFVLLLGLVCLILFMAPKFSAQNAPAPEAPKTEESAPQESVAEEEPVIEETEEVVENRNVKDDLGSYYSLASLKDEGGNLIFTGLYPEDFQITTLSVDYSFCSNRLPGYVTFIVDDAEGSVRFFYFSPQHFWHKISDNKKSFADGNDNVFQMSFFTYDEGKTYIEQLLKKSYPDAKKIVLTDEWDAGEEVNEQLSEIAKAFKKQINTHIDYAHIGSDTEYAPMNSESHAHYLRYELTTSDKHTLFLQFYVPVVCNNMIYSTDERNDHGTVVEWLCLGVYGMVAGNEDLYDDYAPAFQIFMDNCNVNHTFFRILEQRCKDLEKTIAAEEVADAPDAETLSRYASGVSQPLSDFDQMLYVFSTRRGGDQIFVLDDEVVCGPSDTKVAFLNTEKEKVFLSPGEDEYPGDGYAEMTLSEENVMPSADAMESVDDIAEKEEKEKKEKEKEKEKDEEKDKDKDEQSDDEV